MLKIPWPRFSFRIALLSLLLGLCGFQIEANARPDQGALDFLESIRENFSCLKPAPPVNYIAGVTQYVALSHVMASQPRFTSHKLLSELGEAITNDWAVFPPEKKAVGILFKGKVYLLDGHHKALISLYLNATKLPIEILSDWTRDPNGKEISDEEFQKRMFEKRFSYSERFYDLCELEDDPNLYMARLLVQKVKTVEHLENVDVVKVSGANRPLILKWNEGIPFIEFYIADLLAKHGITYKSSWGDRIPAKKLRLIRVILHQEVVRPESPLKDIILLDNYTSLDINDRSLDRKRMKIIYKHMLRKIDCNDMLSVPIR